MATTLTTFKLQTHKTFEQLAQRFKSPSWLVEHVLSVSKTITGATRLAQHTAILCIPIGHHVSLQESVSYFTTGLLEAAPTLPGLDHTIVIPPRRLHLTLGVMSLEDDAHGNPSSGSRKTLPEALSLLSSLRPRVLELLNGARLSVPLQTMGIMPPEGGDPDKAHVLWIGPSLQDEDGRKLKQVGELVNRTFVQAGFITDRRPLKLHCTILNTVYRRPSARVRQPFSYRSVLHRMRPGTDVDWREPVEVNFGTWDTDEIQVCKMGSSGPEGEYLSYGSIHV